VLGLGNYLCKDIKNRSKIDNLVMKKMPNIGSITTITVKKNTKKRIVSLGKMNQSFDELLNEIISHVEKCDQWWNQNR